MGLFFLRVLGGGLLLYSRSGIWTEVLRRHGAAYSGPFGLGGEFRWFLTQFTEPFCTVFVMLGILTRFTAFPPLVAMLVTGLVLPASTAWSLRANSFLLALPFFTITFTGPGDYSFDGRFASLTGKR